MQASGYRRLDVSFWNDEKVSQFSPTDKLIAIYLLAGPQTSRVGTFNFSVGLAAEDLAIPPETVRMGIKRICEQLKWHWDETRRVFHIGPRWWQYNRRPTGAAVEAYRRDFGLLPQCSLKAAAIKTFAQVVGAPTKPETDTETETETETETNTETETPQSPPGVQAHRFDRLYEELPEELDSPEFRELWGDYLRHRGKGLTAVARSRALGKCKGLGHDRAVKALEHSLANGWKGIFEPDQPKRGAGHSKGF